MTIPFHYTYLIGSLLFLIPWIILYKHRPDLRTEMMVMSIIIAFLSAITAYLWWTVDWWQPLTITGTRIGVEDFILGFANGGVAAVLYEEIFKKRLYKRPKKGHALTLTDFVLLFFIGTSWLFYIVHITSFWASTIMSIIVACIIIFQRTDLALNSFASGFFMMILTLPFYWFLIWLSPGWIEQTWLLDHLSGVLVAGIPVEDVMFYFLFGAVVGPFYEYWQGERLRKKF